MEGKVYVGGEGQDLHGSLRDYKYGFTCDALGV